MILQPVQAFVIVLQGSVLILWIIVMLHRLSVASGTPKLTTLQFGHKNTGSYISIVVPARNEEETIGSCLSSLQKQSYTSFEVIVVDDSSTDRTFHIAQEFSRKDRRFKTIKLSTLKKGWVGKNWACYNGFMKSEGELLLFTDADTLYDPNTLSTAVNYMGRRGIDLLTLIPRIDCRGFWAKAILPILIGIIMALYSPTRVNNRDADTAYVFGSFYLIKRVSYLQIGGHKAIQGSIVEDRSMGERAKAHGLKMCIASSGDLVRTRWKEGLSDNWDTLQRVISSSVKGNVKIGVGFAALASVTMLLPYAVLLVILIYSVYVPFSPLIYIILILVLTSIFFMLAVFGYEVYSSLGINPVFTLAQPLSSIVLVAAIMISSKKAFSGDGFKWKGRSYT